MCHARAMAANGPGPSTTVAVADCALVQRLAAELDALDVEKLLPVGLIPDDLGKHPLSLSPSPEELDYLLDLGANDSPDNHRGLRLRRGKDPFGRRRVRASL